MATRSALFVVLVIAAATAGVTAGQQPRIPPPAEMNLYDLLSLGPPPAVSCSCVPHPFALPAYRPGWGYGNGPAAPFEPAPISDDDRRRNQDWYGEEDQHMRRVSGDGLQGNGGASLSVAMHLSVRASIFGPDQNVELEAARWFTLAAQQGHRDAFRMIGYRHAVGRGVPQDYALAAYWFDQGARHDDPIAMTAIGWLRAAGRGAPQDWAAAIRWWQYAETRTPFAARFLGDAYACGAGVEADPERAIAAYQRAGEPSAAIQIGYMHLRACVPRNDQAAYAAFKRAADQGYPDAQMELSELLREGNGPEANPLDAYLWARLAERRLPPGDLKTRAAELAAAAARLVPAGALAYEDRMVNGMLTTGAQPVR